ncbi:hypothetical protein MMC2321_00034 [Chitinophaga sp. MM2321]
MKCSMVLCFIVIYNIWQKKNTENLFLSQTYPYICTPQLKKGMATRASQKTENVD